MVVTTSSQSSPPTQPEQNAKNVLNYILATIQGLARALVNTNAYVQEVIQKLPGLVVGNGANSSAAGPSSNPDEAKGVPKGGLE